MENRLWIRWTRITLVKIILKEVEDVYPYLHKKILATKKNILSYYLPSIFIIILIWIINFFIN